MNLLASAPGWLAAIFFFLLALAALEDGWRMQIANLTSGTIAIAALIAMALEGPIIEVWQNVALFVAVLAAGTLLFDRAWMGGGDVKLMAASVLWFDLSSGWKLLVAIAIAGGLETLVLMGLRRMPWSQAARDKVLLLRRGEAIPYGIAIALGGALMAYWLRS